jgi:hypothetical protein
MDELLAKDNNSTELGLDNMSAILIKFIKAKR